MDAVLEALDDVLEQLAGVDPAALGDGESVVVLHRALASLEAVVTRATAAFDASKDWQAVGAQTAAQWLATECSLPRGVARRRVGLGRRLRHLPACEQAWIDGDITASHVSTIAAVRRPETAEALARDEPLMVDDAIRMRFEAFTRTVAYWEQLADPDGADDREEDRTRRRDVWLDESFGGMWFGKMTLDPIAGTIVGGELDRRERELFEHDWAEARERLGREPTAIDLARTPGQRRADALVAMAARSATAPEGGRSPVPLFSVYVGYETLRGRICELAQGTVISPGALLPWLDEAVIERAVFGKDGRVEVSAKARLFTGATRRAIELRDRECTHRYCDRPGEVCQGDHTVPYADGGPTTQANGRLLCGFHNRFEQRRQGQQRPPPDSSA